MVEKYVNILIVNKAESLLIMDQLKISPNCNFLQNLCEIP